MFVINDIIKRISIIKILTQLLIWIINTITEIVTEKWRDPLGSKNCNLAISTMRASTPHNRSNISIPQGINPRESDVDDRNIMVTELTCDEGRNNNAIFDQVISGAIKCSMAVDSKLADLTRNDSFYGKYYYEGKGVGLDKTIEDDGSPTYKTEGRLFVEVPEIIATCYTLDLQGKTNEATNGTFR